MLPGGYLASRLHVPRALALAACLCGLAGVMSGLPHFLFRSSGSGHRNGSLVLSAGGMSVHAGCESGMRVCRCRVGRVCRCEWDESMQVRVDECAGAEWDESMQVQSGTSVQVRVG